MLPGRKSEQLNRVGSYAYNIIQIVLSHYKKRVENDDYVYFTRYSQFFYIIPIHKLINHIMCWINTILRNPGWLNG